MEKFARRATNKGAVQFVDLQRPSGFFAVLAEHFSGARKDGDLTPLHRICSQARRLGVKTMVLEEIEDSEEMREENEDLDSIKAWNGEHRVRRVSFFSESLTKAKDLASVNVNAFLGYVLWKEDWQKGSKTKVCARVYEAMMPPRADYLHSRGGAKWTCRVNGRDFAIQGYPFFQQNEATNICAHAAARTAAACFHPDSDMTFREMNLLLGKVPPAFSQQQGLETPEIVKILEAAGANCSVAEYHDLAILPTPVPYQRWAYGSIESGYPAILIFGDSTARAGSEAFLHALPVFGHTFNPDMWLPRVEVARFRLGEKLGFIPSEFWMGSFIGHDDNFGPNYSIPRHYLRSMRPSVHDHPQQPSTEGVAWVVSTMPKGVNLRALEAEAVALDFLGKLEAGAKRTSANNVWMKRLFEHKKSRELVLRPILVTKADYVEALKKLRGWSAKDERLADDLVAQMAASVDLERFWMVEVSLPELFPTNKRKLGELLIDPAHHGAQMTVLELQASMVAARLPGCWVSRRLGASPQHPTFDSLQVPVCSHTALFGCVD